MERLTQRTIDGKALCGSSKKCTEECGYCEHYAQMLEKLANYEEQEEKGFIFRLPVSLGKPCYVMEKCTCGIHYGCYGNKKADARKKAKVILKSETEKLCYSCYKVFERPFKIEYMKHFNKTIFATLEEAVEAAEKKGFKVWAVNYE